MFWQRQLASSAGSPVADLRAHVGWHYQFEELPEDVAEPDEDPAYQAALKSLAHSRALAKAVDPGRMEIDKGEWAHLRALGYPTRDKQLDAYLDFIRPLRIRSSMPTARDWVYAAQVDQLARRMHSDRPLDVLEIGLGGGNLGVFLARLGRVRSYTIIDLPSMLPHSAYTVQRFLPDADLRFQEARR